MNGIRFVAQSHFGTVPGATAGCVNTSICRCLALSLSLSWSTMMDSEEDSFRAIAPNLMVDVLYFH